MELHGVSRVANIDVLEVEIAKAEEKAWKALAGYKFWMFGYWAAIWVHLNRLDGKRRPNPFKNLVLKARESEKVRD